MKQALFHVVSFPSSLYSVLQSIILDYVCVCRGALSHHFCPVCKLLVCESETVKCVEPWIDRDEDDDEDEEVLYTCGRPLHVGCFGCEHPRCYKHSWCSFDNVSQRTCGSKTCRYTKKPQQVVKVLKNTHSDPRTISSIVDEKGRSAE
jgi:hypothetical protein